MQQFQWILHITVGGFSPKGDDITTLLEVIALLTFALVDFCIKIFMTVKVTNQHFVKARC